MQTLLRLELVMMIVMLNYQYKKLNVNRLILNKKINVRNR